MAKSKSASIIEEEKIASYVSEMMLKELHPNQMGRLLRGAVVDLGASAANDIAEMLIARHPMRRPFITDMLRRAGVNARVQSDSDSSAGVLEKL